MVAWHARHAGLPAVGVVDHDSIAGADEIIAAGAALQIGVTIGCELRANAGDTPLANRLINAPDLPNILYMVLHAVPRNRYAALQAFLIPIRTRRAQRNGEQVARLNRLLTQFDWEPLDYERDIVPLSEWHNGGSVTERHILLALVTRILQQASPGPAAAAIIESTLGVSLSTDARIRLHDPHNPYYRYDMLDALKQTFLKRFVLPPDEVECPRVRTIVEFGRDIGAIPAYAYLGARDNSPDTPRFEDDWLDLLMQEIGTIGFLAVTYMPPRNSMTQLRRVRRLCHRHDLIEISGVDINSPRQSFNCPQVMHPEFRHLIASTWALIAHEQSATTGGIFDPHDSFPTLEARIAHYATIGRHQYHHRQSYR